MPAELYLRKYCLTPAVAQVRIGLIVTAAQLRFTGLLRRVLLTTWVLVCSAFPGLGHGQLISPLSVTNSSPIALIQGIPAMNQSTILPPNETMVRVDYSVASHYTLDNSSTEQVLFDGETRRATLSIKKGIARHWDVEILLPYVSHNGGGLDGFIDNWHEVFGLPQGGRNKVANNQLKYFYQKNGETRLDITSASSGVGDAQLVFSRRLNSPALPQWEQIVFKSALKLPTGDADRLLGSGAPGLAVWLAANSRTQWFGFEGSHYGSFGAVIMGKGDVLPGQQRGFAVFGELGSGARVSRYIVLQAQLNAHSSLYSGSEFVEINSMALQLTLGGNVEINRDWRVDVGVAEDLLVHASPDVIFHLGVNRRF